MRRMRGSAWCWRRRRKPRCCIGESRGRSRWNLNLRELLAKASPARSGDELAGLAAAVGRRSGSRAQMALADVPLKAFLAEPLIPYEVDEVTRLICDSHDAAAFAPVAHLTVGEFRDWLLSEQATTERLAALAPGRHAGNGRGRFEAHARAGSGDRRGEDAAWSPASDPPSACPDGSRRACSRTIPPTI